MGLFNLIGSGVDALSGGSDGGVGSVIGSFLDGSDSSGGSGNSASSLLSAGATLLGGYETNRQNADIAQQQMQFQQGMSDSSYQRTVASMEAAGLNPMLAYSQGALGTPTGSSAVMQNPVPAAVQSAAQSVAMSNTAADTRKKLADASSAEMDAKVKKYLFDNDWLYHEGIGRAKSASGRGTVDDVEGALAYNLRQKYGLEPLSELEFNRRRGVGLQSNAAAALSNANAANAQADLPTHRAVGNFAESTGILGPLLHAGSSVSGILRNLGGAAGSIGLKFPSTVLHGRP